MSSVKWSHPLPIQSLVQCGGKLGDKFFHYFCMPIHNRQYIEQTVGVPLVDISWHHLLAVLSLLLYVHSDWRDVELTIGLSLGGGVGGVGAGMLHYIVTRVL